MMSMAHMVSVSPLYIILHLCSLFIFSIWLFFALFSLFSMVSLSFLFSYIPFMHSFHFVYSLFLLSVSPHQIYTPLTMSPQRWTLTENTCPIARHQQGANALTSPKARNSLWTRSLLRPTLSIPSPPIITLTRHPPLILTTLTRAHIRHTRLRSPRVQGPRYTHPHNHRKISWVVSTTSLPRRGGSRIIRMGGKSSLCLDIRGAI